MISSVDCRSTPFASLESDAFIGEARVSASPR
jgi:hypothetical protein